VPEWSQPGAGVLFLVFPVLWWLRWHRPAPALLWAEADALAPLAPAPAWWRTHGAAAWHGLAWLAVVLALLGPRWPDTRTRLPAEGIAIVLVLDLSGSMNEPIVWNDTVLTRLQAAQRGFSAWASQRPTDALGLVVFGRHAEAISPLTLDQKAFAQLLQAQTVRPGDDGSNVGDALALALERVAVGAARRQVLLLLSDGEHNVGSPALRPLQAAQLAQSRRVPIYTIDAGDDPESVPDNAEQRAAGRANLQRVAEATGGRFWAAPDGAGLQTALLALDELERQPVTTFRYRRYYDATGWCILAGLVCAGLACVWTHTLGRRLP
jgi:Ca-activated chloride channel family protein